ncbi:predicted protein [Nematostella vectensis]|uniref:Uncharacterized protein n=1 Tax=Nematostella vectensis TaxID=45351 RepID=A7SPC5_NEMVE|nr:predicted protein [Nematostella vectensis]|eukprot:XP_001626554.1 predicted protein [Nematostella vectensis]
MVRVTKETNLVYAVYDYMRRSSSFVSIENAHSPKLKPFQDYYLYLGTQQGALYLITSDRYLIHDVELKLEFFLNGPKFALMSTAQDEKIKIHDLTLNFKHVEPTVSAGLEIERALNAGNTAEYPIVSNTIQPLTIPTGSSTFQKFDLFLNKIPKAETRAKHIHTAKPLPRHHQGTPSYTTPYTSRCSATSWVIVWASPWKNLRTGIRYTSSTSLKAITLQKVSGTIA